mgnify:CR=1 FL=1|jgi:hypothetical protein
MKKQAVSHTHGQNFIVFNPEVRMASLQASSRLSAPIF